MSWTKESHTRRPHEWKLPRSEAIQHEETASVEDLNILPQDITLLPQDIQTGFEKWQRQQINLSSEWTDDDVPSFYPQTFRWTGDGFYSKNFLNVWLDSFYAITGGWLHDFFYPKNYLGVWQPRSDGPKIEPDFYPQSFLWNDGFYAPVGGWDKDDFYPKNYLAVWNDGFYMIEGGWYLTSDCLEAVQTSFKPFGL